MAVMRRCAARDGFKMNDDRHWAPLRFRRRSCGIATLLLFPTVLVAAILSGQHRVWVVIAVYAIWYILYVRLTMWRCPRCGKFFCSSFGVVNPFARHCVNCGLPALEVPENPTL